jgi:ligand-binding SRPBCC domain-containing protein
MAHHLSTRTVLPLDRERVFAFFSDASNLEKLTPPELRFRILTRMPLALEEGSLIDYELRLFAVPFRWQTLIRTWEPPHCFVDEQLRGPYAEWVHTHRFVEHEEGTEVQDDVVYRLPLGPLGKLAYPLVARQLRRIFGFRRAAMQEHMLRRRPAPPSADTGRPVSR